MREGIQVDDREEVHGGIGFEHDRAAIGHDAEVDSEITFDEIILVGEGDSVKVGSPSVAGASVTAKVLSQFRGPKGVAFKFKRRKGFHKTKGFRRSLTRLEITSIAG